MMRVAASPRAELLEGPRPLPVVARLHDLAVRRVGESGGSPRVVELGCGAGLLALRVAAEYPGARVIGVEASSDRVRRARVAAAESGLGGRLRFEQGESHRAALPDAAVDVLLGIDLLGAAPSWSGLLAEVSRVLAPGGRASLFEWLGTAEAADEFLHELEAESPAIGPRVWCDPEWPGIIELQLPS